MLWFCGPNEELQAPGCGSVFESTTDCAGSASFGKHCCKPGSGCGLRDYINGGREVRACTKLGEPEHHCYELVPMYKRVNGGAWEKVQ